MMPVQTSNPLLIMGTSARAAAWSALRSGYSPRAIDCFADTDLADRAWCRRIRNYPQELLSAASELPKLPWMYTGALENYPQLIARLSQHGPLYGNSADVVRAVRDPQKFSEVLRHSGISTPAISNRAPGNDQQKWLIKRRRSAAGLGIRWFQSDDRQIQRNHQDDFSSGSREPTCYYQQFIHGTAWSSLYIGAQNRAVLLGATRQWIGARQLGAREFLYSGSFTTNLCPVSRQRLEYLGQIVAERFSLVGVFGIDWIYADGDVWPLEVNPRYTASCELFEWQFDWPLVAWHVQACRDRVLPTISARMRLDAVCGKGILYATQRVRVCDSFHAFAAQQNAQRCWPAIADIPAVGETIEAGHPIVTLYAESINVRGAKKSIVQLAIAVRRSLAG